MTGFWFVSYVTLWLLFLLVAVVLLSMLRNLDVIYESLATSSASRANPSTTKLNTGEPLPELRLQTLTGATRELSAFRGMKTAISIVSPHCSPCHGLLQEIAEGRGQADPLDPTVRHRVVLSIGGASETATLTGKMRLPKDLPILVDIEKGIASNWGVTSTPTTVIVDDELRVVRQVVGFGGGTAATA